MTPQKPVTPDSVLPGAQLGLIITILGSVIGGLIGVGTIFNHELAPIREDIVEMKTDIRELRDRPAPQAILDTLESLSRRLEVLERQ